MTIYIQGRKLPVTRVYKTANNPIEGYKVMVDDLCVFGSTIDRLKLNAEMVLQGKEKSE